MNPQVNYLIGLAVSSLQKNNADDAQRLLKQVIKLAPKNTDALRLLGVAYAFKKDLHNALTMFDESIRLDAKNWLAYSNRGNILRDLNQFESSLESYEKAISLNPAYAEAHNNKGNLLQSLNRLDEALLSYNKAISLQPNYAEAFNNLGNALKKLARWDLALIAYEKAFQLDDGNGLILGSYLNCKMQLCNWVGISQLFEKVECIDVGQVSRFHPFYLQPIIKNPFRIRCYTEAFMSAEYPVKDDLGDILPKVSEKKIRIGYFSSDFRNHAVSYLMAGVIESHDKEKFELIAISMGGYKADEMRERLLEHFHQFIDVSGMSDIEVAKYSREVGVDIAVDLGGLTQDARPGIFAFRAAPIQIGYLGYLGTMATSFMDYIVADQVIIPPKFQEAYSEKIIYLPSYQANDSKKRISDRVFTREELGLPNKGFVYCCLNNSYKITPEIFDVWARILSNVPDSTLFLLADNEVSQKNLCEEIQIRGIDSSRLVFGGRLSYEEYLARNRVFDLFLDTSPYNAGTTGSDALWAGLPVLTVLGDTFSGRMAASLLTAIDLPELIARYIEEYEEIAIKLALDSKYYKNIKHKLVQHGSSSKLFDTQKFTKSLEEAYTKVWSMHQNGIEPQHIYIQ